MALYGGIEAGGTKFVCAVGDENGTLHDVVRLPTTTPDETLGQAVDFFRAHQQLAPLNAIGIGSFGPVDPDPDSPTFGHITTTPKPGWRHTPFAGAIQDALQVPVGFDTDVNVAALGEHRWGAARGLDTFLYLTIGTGIGGGGMMGGRLMHGLVHPEMGHVRIPHDTERDPFRGSCPFHGDCLEGLACGPALEERWGVRAENLPDDHEAWALQAHYLALGVVNFICTVSPQRIIIGGGIMERPMLFPLMRTYVQQLLNDYVAHPAVLDGIDQYLVPPALGNRAGVSGAIALAMEAEKS